MKPKENKVSLSGKYPFLKHAVRDVVSELEKQGKEITYVQNVGIPFFTRSLRHLFIDGYRYQLTFIRNEQAKKVLGIIKIAEVGTDRIQEGSVTRW